MAIQIRELEERLAAQRAAEATVKAVAEKTTAKGFAFEDVAQLPRTTRRCAARPGRTDRQQLRPDREQAWRRSHHTQCRRHKRRRRTVRHQAKNQRMSKPKIFEELDQALANRGATEASPYSPTRPSTHNRAFHRLRQQSHPPTRRADPDPHLIRSLHLGSMDDLTNTHRHHRRHHIARIDDLIRTARDAIGRTSQIRGLHTKSRTAIDEATTLLNTLDSSVKTVLDQLESAICVAPR